MESKKSIHWIPSNDPGLGKYCTQIGSVVWQRFTKIRRNLEFCRFVFRDTISFDRFEEPEVKIQSNGTSCASFRGISWSP